MSILIGGLGSPYTPTRGLSTGATAAPPPMSIDPGLFLLLSTPPPVYRPPALTIAAGDYLILCESFAQPPPIPPISFIAAVRAALMADAVLSGLTTGGWWHRRAPRGTRLPMGVYRIPNDQRVSSGGPNYIHSGTFELISYATTGELARTIADRTVAVLTDREITFSTGRLYYLRLQDPVSVAPQSATYGGADVFAARRSFAFVYQGRYPS